MAVLVGTVGKERYADWQHRRRLAEQQRIQTALTDAKCEIGLRDGRIVDVVLSTPDALEWLKDESELERVVSYECAMSDNHVAFLAKHSRLQELRIFGDGVTDRSLGTIGAFEDLKSLYIAHSSVTDNGLSQLRNLRNLESLGICYSPIQGRGLGFVTSLPRLSQIFLNGSAIDDEGLSALTGCKGLESIDLSVTRVTGRGLAHLSGLPRLKTIRLHRVKNGSVGGIASLDQVEELDLFESRVDPGFLTDVKEMASLWKLSLYRTQVTDDSLAELSDARQIEVLDLMATRITDAGLVHLRELEQLNLLNLRATAVTDAGARELSAYLPHTKIEYGAIDAAAIAGNDWKDQAKYTTDAGEPIEAEFSCRTLDRRAFARLGGEYRLKKLILRDTDFDDQLAKYPGRLTALTVLDACRTRLSDQGLIHFERLKNLREINVNQTQVTQAGVSRLSRALPNTLIIHSGGRVGPKWIPTTTE